MSDHHCQFQVSIFLDSILMLTSDWTADKAAVIEAMDCINLNRRDVRVAYSNGDDKLLLIKNGYILLTFDAASCPENYGINRIYSMLNGLPPYHLNAVVVTKGNGGVTLNQAVSLGV